MWRDVSEPKEVSEEKVMPKSTNDEKPNPGTPEAAAAGCTCPRMDNGWGKGSGRIGNNGEPLFWYSQGCPVHGSEYEAATKGDGN